MYGILESDPEKLPRAPEGGDTFGLDELRERCPPAHAYWLCMQREEVDWGRAHKTLEPIPFNGTLKCGPVGALAGLEQACKAHGVDARGSF